MASRKTKPKPIGATVAMLRLPVGSYNLRALLRTLTLQYGDVSMTEEPKGWLDIRQPKPLH